ncbi:hypothetical protein DF043_36705 [Burkholderia cepacia]|nr:hypothetical protein DF043_36705 [Burkholderia cepacia]
MHENGQAASGVADRVLRDQQSVQRFAQRGKHRFLITNAGLLRWTPRACRNPCGSGKMRPPHTALLITQQCISSAVSPRSSCCGIWL